MTTSTTGSDPKTASNSKKQTNETSTNENTRTTIGTADNTNIDYNPEFSFLNGQMCCHCIEIRGGMIILSVIFVIDSFVELIFSITFVHLWMTYIYAILCFFGGISGLVGAGCMKLFFINVFYYWSYINVILQCIGCIYLAVFLCTIGQYFYGILLIIDMFFGIGVWWYLIGVIKRFRDLTFRNLYQPI